MHPSADFDYPPDAVQALRDRARTAILWLLWLMPAVLGGLAARGGMGWELVTVLGFAMAMGTTLGSLRRGPGRRGRLLLGLALGVATGLLLGAGRGTLPYAVTIAVPFVVLALVGALGCGRALLGALAVLMVTCLLPLGGSPHPVLPLAQVGGLAMLAVMLVVAQRLWRRAARVREQLTVLPPPPVRAGCVRMGAAPKIFSQPAPGSVPPAFLVQAERAPDGTVRVAMAGREAMTGHKAGRLRVTVS